MLQDAWRSFYRTGRRAGLALALGGAAIGAAHAEGSLQPVGAAAPFEVRSHQVRVVINNGYAMTEIEQVFFNPGAADAEAVYACPLPMESALSEFALTIDGREVQGEVVEAQRAEQVYQSEKSAGRDTALAKKNDFRSMEFRVSPVRAGKETRVRHVYYQPLPLDTGTARYVYPLEDGGTDSGAKTFWSASPGAGQGAFKFSAEIKSAFPIDAVRVPNPANAAISQLEPGRWTVEIDRPAGGDPITGDVTLYYRLAGEQPGRLEAVPYREPGSPQGTVMLVFTPGVDLKPITNGIDWVFALDVSGSMETKMGALADGMERALAELKPEDRFRVVTFNDNAAQLIPLRNADPSAVRDATQQIRALRSGGSTNLFAAMDLAMKGIDADRTTALTLITDGVANQGPTEAAAFERLLRGNDVRVFTAVMGNSANWPLMEIIAQASQGFCLAVSTSDDLVGRLLLARNKITHEALHDVNVETKGIEIADLAPSRPASLYHGQQLVMFGHYTRAGRAEVTLSARVSGKPERFTLPVDLPEADVENPEIDRLWAMARCEELKRDILRGGAERDISRQIAQVGVAHSIVTDYTSMVVVSEERGKQLGLGRSNSDRVEKEIAARDQRAQQPARSFVPQNSQVASNDPSNGFGPRAPRIGGGGGGGGGAIDPITGTLALLALGGGALASRRNRGKKGDNKRA